MVFVRVHDQSFSEFPHLPRSRPPKRKAHNPINTQSKRILVDQETRFASKAKELTTKQVVVLLKTSGKMGLFHKNPDSKEEIQFTTAIVNSPIYNVRMDENLNSFLKRINKDLSIRGVKTELSEDNVYIP